MNHVTPSRHKSSTLDKPRCSHPGCSNYVSNRGLCRKHAYPGKCSHPGCKALAQRRGLCSKHLYPCAKGCGKQAKAGGYCIEHAKEHDREAYDRLRANQSCKFERCEKFVKAGGYCSEHAQQYAEEAHRKYRLQANEKRRVRDRDRYNNDPNFKIQETIRKSIKKALKGVRKSDNGKLENYLGCTAHQLRQYFENNHFQKEGNEWMNLENWGGKRCHINQSWELDHIMPISSFDLSDEEELKKCFHLSNYQPLSWQDNLKKGDSIPEGFEWCSVKERWLWSEASGKTNYELPTAGEEDSVQ